MEIEPAQLAAKRSPLSNAPLTVLSLRDQVHQVLRAAILKGTFRADERLNERQLAAELGVSTTPLKEALRQLEADGLVETLPRRGVVVKFDRAWAEEMVFARAALEAIVARLAAQRITDEQMAALTQVIERMRIATAGGPAEELVALNEGFHDMIHSIASGQYLRHLIERQQVYDAETRRVIHSRPGEREAALAEHSLIGQAIMDRRFADAEHAMRDHVLRAGVAYLSIVFGVP